MQVNVSNLNVVQWIGLILAGGFCLGMVYAIVAEINTRRRKIAVECRNCQWTGRVALGTRHVPGHKPPAVTGVPCPACKKHNLRRV